MIAAIGPLQRRSERELASQRAAVRQGATS
jgi:hypothetical protein